MKRCVFFSYYTKKCQYQPEYLINCFVNIYQWNDVWIAEIMDVAFIIKSKNYLPLMQYDKILKNIVFKYITVQKLFAILFQWNDYILSFC